VQLQALAQFVNAKFIDVAMELLQQVLCLLNCLYDVLGLLFFGHDGLIPLRFDKIRTNDTSS
jgi:hypothetical protein